MALTNKQKRAVECRGENVLVSASAGSGKTTAMVGRIIELLKEGESLENMLIITFTKAAASDMRDKISKAIIALRDRDQKFDAQLRILPSAKIGTIDSWCGNIVKNYFYAADTDADYELLTDGEKRELCDRAVDSLVEEFAEKDENFRVLYENFVSNRRDTDFKQFVFDGVEFAKSRENPTLWIEKSCEKYDSLLAKKIVEEHYDLRASAALSSLEEIKKAASAVKYDKLAKHCDSVHSSFLNGGKFDIFRGNSDFAELNQQIKKVKENLKSLLAEKAETESFTPLPEVKKQAEAAAKFISAVYSGLVKEKKRRALADYGDIEHTAYEILCLEAGDEIRKTCKYVFVDEYQDVNPLQDALIHAAVGQYLFIVGDVKQSIYAFRMSDPDIFLEKFTDPARHGFGESIEFTENFRSGTAVINYANAVFSRAMSTSFGGVDYLRAKLVFGKSEDGGEVRLRLIGMPEKSEKKQLSGIYDLRNYENEEKENARVMATHIVRGIAERLEKPDEKGNRVEEKDIAVLFRSNGEVVRLVYDMLKNGGINVFLCRKNYFSSAKEVRAVNQFINLLAFGEDDVSMLGYLLSPLCGISEDELYAAASGKGGFCRKVRDYVACHDDAIAKKLSVALDRIAKYTELSRSQSVSELVSGLIAETDYDVKLLASPEGEIALETLVRFTEYLSSLKSASSVADYVRYMTHGDGKYDSPSPAGSLKMMTIHTAKGLQYPYVFLIDCDKKFNLSDENMRYFFDGDWGLCLKTGKKGDCSDNYMTRAAKLKLAKKQKEEEMRLLYVALTRAEKGLYVYAYDKTGKSEAPENASCFLDWLKPVSSDCVEIAKKEEVMLAETEDECAAAAPPDTELVRLLSERIRYVYPFPSREIKTTVTGMVGEEEKSAAQNIPDDDAIMQKGTAYHAIMQKIDFTVPFEQERERLKNMFTDEISVPQIKAAHEYVSRLLCDFGGKVYREQSFVVDFDGTLVQGIIDLMAINGKRALILDYKLSGEKNLLSDKYVGQINAYADAVEKVLKIKAEQLILYSFTSKTAKKVERRSSENKKSAF